MRPERFDFREDDRIDTPKLKAPLREAIASNSRCSACPRANARALECRDVCIKGQALASASRISGR
jgi:hypothetical protein